jgi:hypothetical protein
VGTEQVLSVRVEVSTHREQVEESEYSTQCGIEEVQELEDKVYPVLHEAQVVLFEKFAQLGMEEMHIFGLDYLYIM